MKPQDVVSPRSSWQLIDVIWDGPQRNTGWSIALGRWNDGDHWSPVLAQRWDGSGDGKGMPLSTGYAVWFILPDVMYPMFVESEFVPPEKRALVKTILGLDRSQTAA